MLGFCREVRGEVEPGLRSLRARAAGGMLALAAVAAGATVLVEVRTDVLPSAYGPISATAAVSLAEPDPIPANNSATEGSLVLEVEVYRGDFESGTLDGWSAVFGGV